MLFFRCVEVRSYDGGSHRGRAQYDVRHVLTPLVDPYHSSNNGTKFNLVLALWFLMVFVGFSKDFEGYRWVGRCGKARGRPPDGYYVLDSA